MKSLRQLCATIILALSLSLTAFADGQMPCGIADPSNPPVLESDADGHTPCGIADSLTGLASDVMQSLIAMF